MNIFLRINKNKIRIKNRTEKRIKFEKNKNKPGTATMYRSKNIQKTCML